MANNRAAEAAAENQLIYSLNKFTKQSLSVK
jgi:hypothetical protein